MEGYPAQEISAVEAVRRGHLVTTVPVALGMFITILGALILYPIFGSVLVVVATFICGLAVIMLYGAQAHIRWRIWAFSRVNNVHELRDLAVLKGLLLKRSSLLGIFEFATLEQRRKLLMLDRRFEEKNVFPDDVMVGQRTALPRRKTTIVLSLGASVAAMLLGIGVLIIAPLFKGAVLLGVTLVISGVLGVLAGWKKWRVCEVPLVLSDDGIESLSTGFIRWEDICDEAVENHGGTDGRIPVLTFRAGDAKPTVIYLAEFLVKEERMLYLLRLYRGRHNARQGHSL